MQHSIGKTIKELRKSRGLTQEELAEKIGVTAQAISKWENESGMPDLSQIVPLAHVFGVSTDTILGTGDIKKNEDISEIMRRAQSKLTFPLTIECLTDKYNVLLEGLKIYPNNFTLILQVWRLKFLSLIREILFMMRKMPKLFTSRAKDMQIQSFRTMIT